MPKWAMISIYAISTAVVASLTTYLLLQTSQDRRWEIGTVALVVALGNLTVVALSLTALASLLRFQDRRRR